MENFDFSLVNWSRAQFALTAMYHWLFVPLTLGLSYIVAIMETIYVRTGKEEWKRITKFWMTLFGINFAIGVATGIILEFEFGTNWSNYSWFVGDIFGAPLAIEGIMAFFLESTFIAVMFFGWNKVNKRFHLLSSWLVAFGASLSALWILVANGWMQFPAGMHFNPDTARNEMLNFWEVLFSPVAINKFLHTITSGYVFASIFVIGVSSWYILKKREIALAKKSIAVASIFGIMSGVFLVWTGDGSAYQVAQKQPMKLAAMEGLYEGEFSAGLIAVGVLTPGKEYDDDKDPHIMKIEIPKLLSFLGYRSTDAYVPGIKDLIEGGYEIVGEDGTKSIALSAQEKIDRGKLAINALAAYTKAKEAQDTNEANTQLTVLKDNFQYFGYGYFNDVKSLIPNVPIAFYSFRIMVGLGFFFLLLFALHIYLLYKNKITKHKWLLIISLFTIPLAYVASEAGWVVAELGRQPWVIQDIMPTMAAVSHIDSSVVQITFWMFAITLSILVIAEIRIMISQIKSGPKVKGEK